MEIAFFWDIDGTLLTTNRAGIFAWEEAVTAVTGIETDLTDLPTAGLTDAEIGRQILTRVGRTSAPGELDQLLMAYATLLPQRLGYRQGRVLPGVVEVLTALQQQPDCRLLLLTGNLRPCAFAKLRHYGLDHFFTEGAFAEDGVDRVGVARRAHQLAGDSMLYYVIGDTPHDVACGQAIGARTIAIATGTYSMEQLAASRPWHVLAQLPSPDAFHRLVGLA